MLVPYPFHLSQSISYVCTLLMITWDQTMTSPGTPPPYQVLLASSSSSPPYAQNQSPDLDNQWLSSNFSGAGRGNSSSPSVAQDPFLGSWQGPGHNILQPILAQSRSEHCWIDQKGLPHRFQHASSVLFEHTKNQTDSQFKEVLWL